MVEVLPPGIVVKVLSVFEDSAFRFIALTEGVDAVVVVMVGVLVFVLVEDFVDFTKCLDENLVKVVGVVEDWVAIFVVKSIVVAGVVVSVVIKFSHKAPK